MFALTVRCGKHQGRKVLLPEEGEIVLGRDEGCHMRLASSLVSRRHCTLGSSPEGVVVTDLQSQNGTFVNDVAITEPTILRPGDMLRVGATAFELTTREPERVRINSSLSEKQKGISDAEIADWLTDNEPGLATADSGETTEIAVFETEKASRPTARPQSAIAEPESPVPDMTVPETEAADPESATARAQKKSKSIADEAAEIIRRHWEAIEKDRPSGDVPAVL